VEALYCGEEVIFSYKETGEASTLNGYAMSMNLLNYSISRKKMVHFKTKVQG